MSPCLTPDLSRRLRVPERRPSILWKGVDPERLPIASLVKRTGDREVPRRVEGYQVG